MASAEGRLLTTMPSGSCGPRGSLSQHAGLAWSLALLRHRSVIPQENSAGKGPWREGGSPYARLWNGGRTSELLDSHVPLIRVHREQLQPAAGRLASSLPEASVCRREGGGSERQALGAQGEGEGWGDAKGLFASRSFPAVRGMPLWVAPGADPSVRLPPPSWLTQQPCLRPAVSQRQPTPGCLSLAEPFPLDAGERDKAGKSPHPPPKNTPPELFRRGRRRLLKDLFGF